MECSEELSTEFIDWDSLGDLIPIDDLRINDTPLTNFILSNADFSLGYDDVMSLFCMNVHGIECSPCEEDNIVRKIKVGLDSHIEESIDCYDSRESVEHSNTEESVVTSRARGESPRGSSGESWSYVKRKRKRRRLPAQKIGGRSCGHCMTKESPQWRRGPMGSKTLCNACGVRFRKGKLLPEYRPAKSPTFDPSLHSNSYKKLLEIRAAYAQHSCVQ